MTDERQMTDQEWEEYRKTEAHKREARAAIERGEEDADTEALEGE